MGKVLKIFLVFLIVTSVALSTVFVTTWFAPGFREDVEIFLNIDDENAISTLKDKIKEYEEQVNGYESRIETLKKNISELETTVDELQVEDEFLRSEISRLQTRVQELEKQAENLDGTIDDLNSQIEQMNKEVDQLWNIFNNLNEYENALNNGTNADTELTENEKKLLEEKIESLEETVKELTEEIKELNETIEDLEEQIENLENQKIEVQNQKIINENIIVDKTKNIDEINVTVNNYYNQLEYINNSIINNNIVINELQKKQENGEGLSEKEAKQLEDLQSQNKSFESQKYDINKNLTECENRVATLQSEVSVLQRNNENYVKQIASLDSQIDEIQSQIVELESEAVNVQSNINSLQDRINKFNGLIGNSTIKNENGDVVQEPTNPVNPEKPVDPEQPPVGDLTLNIQGESVLKLPLTNMQNEEQINKLLNGNDKYYFEELPKEDDFSGVFDIIPKATNIYMVVDKSNENIMCMVILYEDEVSAQSIFETFEKNKDYIISENIELNCVAQCGNVGIIEVTEIPCEHIAGEIETLLQGEDENYYYYLDVTHCIKCHTQLSSNYYSVEKNTENKPTIDEMGVASIGESNFNLPIYKLTSYREIIGYFDGNENYGYQDLTEGSVEAMKLFEGSQNFIAIMQVGNENTQAIIIIFDNEENASKIFTTLEANKDMILADGLTLDYVAQYKNVGLFELTYHASECSHRKTSQSQENYYETDTEIIYDLVIICQECGKEISRQTITQAKETTVYENYVIDTITGKEHKINFDDGMTWEMWINSDYNNLKFVVVDNFVYSADKTKVLSNYDENGVLVPISIYDKIYTYDTYKLYAVETTCNHNELYTKQGNVWSDENYTYTENITYCSNCGEEVNRYVTSEYISKSFSATNETEFQKALESANDGDIIYLDGVITLTSQLNIDKNVTIQNGAIEGSSLNITAKEITIQNVSFSGLMNENETQESYIYANNYYGSLRIYNCSFNDVEWEAIQIVPVRGANIIIESCNFYTGNASQQRYIHIEASKDEIADCNIIIVNNTFYNLEMLDSADGTSNNGEAVGIYYCNLDNISLLTNSFYGNLTIEDLRAKVCISNEAPWQTSESMFESNNFNSLM